MAASLLIHLLLLLLFRGDGIPDSPYAAAGPRAGDDRAAPAGGGMQAVNLQLVPPREEERIRRPPAPVPAPEVTVELEEEPEPEAPPIELADVPGVLGERDGPEPGPGLVDGDGQGDGGTAEEGRFRVVPPMPRGLILPPSDRPDKVRGREVEVWVFVTTEGTVVADSTRLVPPTGDRGFDRKLRRQAAEWVFEPAQKEGRPVAEWFRYVIVM